MTTLRIQQLLTDCLAVLIQLLIQRFLVCLGDVAIILRGHGALFTADSLVIGSQ